MLDLFNGQDAVNKRYLESQFLDYVKTNGANPVSWNLNMNNYKVENFKDTDSSSSATEAVKKKYADGGLNTKLNAITQGDLNMNNNGTLSLKIDGSKKMAGALDMGDKKIVDLADGTADKDAVVFKQVKTLIDDSHAGASNEDNVF